MVFCFLSPVHFLLCFFLLFKIHLFSLFSFFQGERGGQFSSSRTKVVEQLLIRPEQIGGRAAYHFAARLGRAGPKKLRFGHHQQAKTTASRKSQLPRPAREQHDIRLPTRCYYHFSLDFDCSKWSTVNKAQLNGMVSFVVYFFPTTCDQRKKLGEKWPNMRMILCIQI
jgi:hypothetical protein